MSEKYFVELCGAVDSKCWYDEEENWAPDGSLLGYFPSVEEAKQAIHDTYCCLGTEALKGNRIVRHSDNKVVWTWTDETGTAETAQTNWTGGVKYDQEKPDFTLLPWDALAEVVKVLEYGAKKYARDNWRLIDASRYERAGLRHRVARLRGEETDPESGLSHLTHEACCLLFQIALSPKPNEETSE